MTPTDPIDLAALELLRGLVAALEAGAVMVTGLRASDPAEDEPSSSASLIVKWRARGALTPADDVPTPSLRSTMPARTCVACRSTRLIELGDGAVCPDCGLDQPT